MSIENIIYFEEESCNDEYLYGYSAFEIEISDNYNKEKSTEKLIVISKNLRDAIKYFIGICNKRIIKVTELNSKVKLIPLGRGYTADHKESSGQGYNIFKV